MKKNWTNYIYIFTIVFFTLGFFNIAFAWLGLLCITLPFVLLAKNGQKLWCQKYCPRAGFFSFVLKSRFRKGRSVPSWLIRGKGIMLVYFSVNLFILFMSTMMVFKGRIEAIDKIRFMIAFQLPWDIPQLINVEFLPEWAVHLSFRIYSMMFTTTVIGLILGAIFKPRTWCTICPVNTLSDMVLQNTTTGKINSLDK